MLELPLPWNADLHQGSSCPRAQAVAGPRRAVAAAAPEGHSAMKLACNCFV
jgi:hypothetical protein